MLPPPLQKMARFDNLSRFYKVFGPMNARAVDDVETPDKRGAPGPQRVFIPYIFKRGYDAGFTLAGDDVNDQ